MSNDGGFPKIVNLLAIPASSRRWLPALLVALLIVTGAGLSTTTDTTTIDTTTEAGSDDPFEPHGSPDAVLQDVFGDQLDRWQRQQMRTQALPDDPLLGSQWGTSPETGVDAQTAWTVTRGDGSVVVAVLDSGIQADHEDLATALAGYDALDKDTTPVDTCGHGTHVAGIIGAMAGNGRGMSGIANTTILPVKVLGDLDQGCTGDFDAVADGIIWATDEGADIINFSFGCSQPCYHQGVKDALRYAHDRGVLIVGSAGNETGGPVTFPADQPEVMAVSATAKDGSWAPYSAKGSEVEILAPGTSILSTYTEGSYQWMSGTSMAAPHVTGVAALTMASTGLTGDDLREHLKGTATDLGLEPEVQGAGAVDAARAIGADQQPPETTASPDPVAAFFSY